MIVLLGRVDIHAEVSHVLLTVTDLVCTRWCILTLRREQFRNLYMLVVDHVFWQFFLMVE